LGLIIVAGTIAVGVSTGDIGSPVAVPNVSPAAAPSDTKLLAGRARAAEPSPNAERCDQLAAHPDDPGKPRGVPGQVFDAMTEAATRQAIEICAAALGEDAANSRAQFNLGRAYQRLGMLRPQEKAEAWRRAGEAYAAAADRGYAAAQANLGQMLYGGALGQKLYGGADLKQDDRQAIDWLRQAAAGNYADAYLTLAHAYATGRGVGQPDQRKAYCWLTLLQNASSIRAYRSLAQQQRAAMLLNAADKKQIDDSARRPQDCL
jgi:TPR repeat protein